VRITFLGATGTVTGSKYLLEAEGRTILIDCGLFQGFKQLRLRNWKPLPIRASAIDAVVLTHAHIDHSGYLPLLVREGFKGRAYCSHATRALLELLLPDSGHIQEEEAGFANRHGYSKHQPALPLYTEEDARAALAIVEGVDYDTQLSLGKDLRCRFAPVGHILGAAFLHIATPSGRIVFSGDVGRPNDPIMNAPQIPRGADWLVVESTYGNRLHSSVDPAIEIADAVNRVAKRGGVMIVPAFAIGRAQTIMLYLERLKGQRLIPDVPVFLNSPMATDATAIYCAHRSEHRLSPDECASLCKVATFVNTVEESKALNGRSGPMIIISASGMATGGRVLHHLKAFAPNHRNMILLSGYQAGGTRGAALAAGAETIKIHGEIYPVRAEVRQLSATSAHADADELLGWMRSFGFQPRRVFVTHGEPDASDKLRQRIESELHWPAEVPDYTETVDLHVDTPESAK
jgi:metallo-beta-lactamase family protein